MSTRFIIFIMFLFLSFLNTIYGQDIKIKVPIYADEANWFGKSTINTIVLLQKFENGRFTNHGVGILTSPNNYNESIIVTCEHVLRNKSIYVVVNPDPSFIEEMKQSKKESFTIDNVIWAIDGNYIRTQVDLIKNKTYVIHPNGLDIAAFSLKLGDSFLIADTIQKPYTITNYIGNRNFGNRSMVYLGQDVYFIGFPFGLGTDQRLEPLLRSGVVSWTSLNEDIFLLDAVSYGGNSGSPIFTKMVLLDKNRSKPYFIGMVIGHLGTEFENYGLAKCVYIDDIEKVINTLIENKRNSEK